MWSEFRAHTRDVRPVTPPALLAMALILVACGTAPVTPASTAPAVTTVELAVTSSPIQVVTLDDNGNIIDLPVGARFSLELDETHVWVVSIVDPAIISRDDSAPVPPGVEGVYAAHAAGTVTLMALGDPVCRQSQPPCSAPPVQFVIAVVVQ